MKPKINEGFAPRSRRITRLLNLFVVAALLSTLVFTGCQKDPVDTFNEQALDDYLNSLPPISMAMPAEKSPEIVETEVDTTIEYITKTDYYSVAAGYDEQIVLNPATDVIYPGALVKGETILDGTYNLIPAVRKPITISTSLTGGSSVSVVVEDPKLSTVREAVNSLMKQEYNVPPANMGFTIEQAYSEEQLDMSLRVSYKTPGTSIKGSFDYSNKQIKTRLVAKFIQSYYTLDMDLPSKPSDLFEEEVDQALFGTYMPMYVSTVTFGRMALFTIESTLDETEVKATLNAAYGSVTAGVSMDMTRLKENSTMKVYVLGGSGSSAAATVDGFDSFKQYIIDGGNFSKDSPGAPIAYKLRYIRDNSIGKIVFAASYPIVTSMPRTDNIIYDIKTRLYSFKTEGVDDAGGNCELKGEVYTWPKSIGSGVKHDHLTIMVTMGLDAKYDFTRNTTTEIEWKDMLQSDAIITKIDIREDDGISADDQFTPITVEIPVSEIILNAGTVGYYDRDDLTVYDGNEKVTVTLRFTPVMRRLKK